MDEFKALVSTANKGGSERLYSTELQLLTPAELLRMHKVDNNDSNAMVAGPLVTIAVRYSSLNYKDALGVSGKGSIFKASPIVGGIDLAGEVTDDPSATFAAGTPVIVTGCGTGEERPGGYSELAMVPLSAILALPKGLSLKEAMLYGTAGFTAGLCMARLFANNQRPEQGPLVITGASGGVGSIATVLASNLGFEVWAVSGKKGQHQWLKSLGATQVLTPEELGLGQKPLEAATFGGAIDNVGGDLLAGLLRHIDLWGNIASVGLAGGYQLSSSVMPHILRGVSLLGISSNNCYRDLREEVWQKLTGPWRVGSLATLHKETIGLSEIVSHSAAMLHRQTTGRTLVDLKKE